MNKSRFPQHLAVIADQNELEKAYWFDQLNQTPGGILPKDKISGVSGEHAAMETCEVPVSKEQAREILRICKSSDDKLYSFLTAIVCCLIHKYRGSGRFCVSSPIYRQDEDQEYINRLLPLPVSIDKGDTIRKAIIEANHTISSSIKHQNFPIEYFIERYADELQAGDTKIYETVVALRNIHDLEYLENIDPSCIFDFNRSGNHITLNLLTRRSDYTAETVGKIIRDFDQILSACVSDINTPLSDIAIRSYKLKTCIIGRSSIAIRCAEILRENGHQVVTVITNDRELRDYATSQGISCSSFRNTRDISETLSGDSFDYLFSINNPKILAHEVLDLPETGTINYHDSLLPSYAGMYVTTWAISGGERKHGITWHAVEKGIDTGDILAQETVEVDPDETVFSLNLKCYDAAIHAFERLLSQIELGTVERRKQDLKTRSYFPLHKRPFAAGLISFSDSAENIEAQVRSLDFQDYDNPLTLSKLEIGGQLYRPVVVKVSTTISTSQPGTVVNVEHERLIVATGSHDLEVHELRPLFGAQAPDYPSLEGNSLLIPDSRMKRLDEVNSQLTRHEGYWTRELEKIVPPQLLMLDDIQPERVELEKVEISWADQMVVTGPTSWEEQVVSSFLLFLYRVSGDDLFGVQYSDDNIEKIVDVESLVFSQFVPLVPEAGRGNSANSFITDSLKKLSKIRSSRTFLRDVMVRYTGLRSRFGESGGFSNVKISCVTDFDRDCGIQANELLHLVIQQDTKSVTLWYNKAAIQSQSITRFVSAFQHFLQNAMLEPDKAVMEISMIGESEKNLLLHEYNNTAAEFTNDTTLCRFFDESAVRYGDRIALVFQEEELTYRALSEKVDQLAAALIKSGVEKGEPVSILTRRSFEMVIAMIAVLKAGGTYIPLDLNQPFERIAKVAKQVAIKKHIVYKVDHREMASVLEINPQTEIVFDLDSEAENWEDTNIKVVGYTTIFEHPASPFTSRSTPEDVAYVIHTSGSTGEPKGVVVKHRPVINILEWVNKTYQVSPDDRLLFVTSIGFDLSVYDVFGTLGAGASLYIATEDEVKEPRKLCSLIAEAGISIWDSTPGTLQEMSQYFGDLEGLNSSLRLVMLSGDWISLGLPPALWEHFGDIRILGMGGATEATIWSNYFDVKSIDPRWMSIPYGKPIQNCRYYIVDEYFNVCPVGVEGDLFIGGICVAEGYLNKPELTNHRFIQNPWISNEKIYRTGDRARWSEDGNMEFLGRLDDQVKIRGFRIELGEIEHQLLNHDSITDAKVIVKTLENEKTLVAYYLSEDPISLGDLRKYLQSRLPRYMIPGHAVRLDKMPLTSNGKVDKGKLPDPVVVKEDNFEPPQTKLEHALVAIWSEVLKLDPAIISINTSFFEIGGHSLRATVLVNKILEATGVVMPLRDVFEHQDIKSMATYVSQKEKSSNAGLTKAPVQIDYPLSSPQKRLYFLYELEKESLVYNMPRMVRLEGALEEKKIERVFQQLIERHEILRTSFVVTSDEPRQQILTEVSFELERFSCSAKELQATFDSFVRPFDLASGQLIRAGIVSSTEDPNDYVLMVDQHHIVTDGISQGILIDEFTALYEGKLLEALPLQYKDFAWWQHELSEDSSFRASKAFWEEAFAGDIPVLDLPLDVERPDFKSNAGDIYGFSLNQEAYQGIKKLTENTGTTLYTLLLSVFNIVLARLGNQHDIVVGTPVAGRQHAQLEPLVGMFINTLPIRNFPEATKSFLGFLEEVQAKNLNCFDHQSYPYEELVESLQLARNTGRNPLFDVFFSHQNFESSTLEVSGMTMQTLSNPHRISKFDLTLMTVEAPSELHLNFEYSTELFTRETIERFAGYFRRVIEAVRTNPEILIRDIDMLGSEERGLLVEKFNQRHDFSAVPKTEKNLVQLFKEQVNTTPNQRALVFKEEQLTYLELDQRSDQLALALRQKDVGAGDMIGILIDRSSALIVAILGVLKTGCAYLPIDVQNPVVRTKQILAEGKAKLLLTSLNYQEAYEDTLPVFIPETEQMQSAGQASDQPPMNLSNELMAYVIFTSGTTGKPKGVPISHANVINLIESQQKIYQIEEEENILLFSNIAFDASVEQIWLALLHGATLVVSASDHIENPAELNQYLIKNKVTHLHTTPSYLATLDLQEPNYIERIVVGGEALPQKLADRYAQYYELYNEYGPTEITVTATVAELKKDEAVTIGRPLSHLETYILGKNMELLPIGTVGELFIGGKSVSTGYINNPEEAKARFLDNPFAEGNMYKTGDLARWNLDGTIQYLGRIDEQFQVRGYRVETGEISGQIESHPKIKEAAVIGWQDRDETSLMAFFTSDESISATELREFLVQRLPGYMVPAYFRKVDELPTTQNGKLDKAALRESQMTSQVDESKPFESMPMKGDSFEPAQSELEHELVTIWAEILKLDPSVISIGKSFFEIGGHSLRAIVMINRILEATGVAVPLRDVFHYQNIKSIAAFISQQEKNFDSHLDKAPVLPDYPLSSPQRRLYFLYEMEKESLVYNMPRMVRLEGDLDEQRIEAAFRQLIEKHEILRTSYVMTNDEPRQQILTEVSFELERFVASRAELQATFDSFVRPFDLFSGQLIRAGIVSSPEDPNDFVLMVDQHHIATDGVSQGILINEFMALYEDKPLEALSLQYKDFAWWQHGLSGEGSFKESETFWKTEFAGEVPVLNLPTDFERPVFKQNQGEMYGFSLDQETYQSLRKLTENTGTTLYTVVLSIFNIVLARLGNQEDIVVGTPVAGRQHAQLESMAGMFVNTLPIRNFPGGTKPFLTFLNEVQERNLDCFDHQSYPYEELVESLLLTRDTSRNPLFDVLLSYQNFETASLEISGMSMESLANPHRISKFDMTLHATEAPSELRLALEYSTELFTRETIERFSGYFIRVAEAIRSNPEMLIRDIDMLGSEERSFLIETFNKEDDTIGAQKAEKNLIQRFKIQVNTTPDHKALVFKEESLTYLELDQCSDRLAFELEQAGIKPGDKVGILIDRSPALIVGILAVLKMGGTYLPIDVQNPEFRTKYVLEAAAVKILLTTAVYQKQYADVVPTFVPEKSDVVAPRQKSELPYVTCSGESTAYVIFTSGTTGKPKGVPISHANAINSIDGLQEIYKIDTEENILLFSNIAFDASVEQVWLPLLHGATLVILSADHIGNQSAFNEYLIKNKVSHLHTTPSYLATLNLPESNHIQRIIVGGEACPPKLAMQYAGTYDFYNKYGLSETTVTATITRLSEGDEQVTIGKPLRNVKAYILGKTLELLPVGVAGELYIGGKGVASGYLNNPEQSKARFLQNPWGEGNMYKTGDLARWTADGTIQYIGRMDEQLQIRGYRVEPDETGGHLLSHPKINEAAVVGWQDGDGLSLVAFFTSDDEVTERELREFLLRKLPDYMVPTYFRKIDELPTTHNGKLDKVALRESQMTSQVDESKPFESMPMKGDSFEPAQSELEHELVTIWAEILKLDPSVISIDKSFFEIGGHSLRAIVMINRVLEATGVAVPLRDVFHYQNIKSIAAFISQQEKNFDSHIDKAPLLPDYPLSSPQRRLYFLYEMEKESLVYNMPRMVRLEGDLDEQRIEAAFRQLIERHEILRTSYVMTNDEPRQQVLTEVSFELERFSCSAEELQATFDSFVRPFDLFSGQLIRAGIVSSTEDPNDFVLMVDQHHIATDGVSQGILINEFMALYEDKPLEALSLQYKDFAWWQHGLSGEGSFKESETFWKTEFAGEVPVLNLPTDFERPVFKQNQGEMYGFSLDQETYQSLRKLTENTGTTLYTVVLSIFNIVLARLGNQEDIVVGTPVAGRQHAQLDSMAGMFVNTLPIRNFPGGTKSFLTFLNEVQERNLDCFDHQSYPYEELVESLQLTRDTSRNPLFDVLLSYQNFETASLEISGMSMESLANPHRISKFDMTLHATEAPSELRLALEYSTELFTRETIERFSGYFIRVAEAIRSNPEMLIRDIDMLGSEERSLLIETFNQRHDFSTALKTEKNLIQLFKEQVNTQPNQRALAFNNEEKLTYLELDQCSDRLAFELEQAGIKPGDKVGILIDRSPALIVGILGVLKMGGTYLPIDVQNPEFRTKYVLEAAAVKLLLTTAVYQKQYEDVVPVFVPGKSDVDAPRQKSELPYVTCSNESIAYVIFTSGTTGKPKGVPISHANVINLIESQQKIYQVEAEENVLLFSNIAFDASVGQIWLALLHGATLVISASDHIENPVAFNQYLIKNKVTHLHITPSYLATLDLQEPNYIKRIAVGGEALPQKLADRYAQHYEFYNEYGPTEITVVATVAKLKKDEAVTIGRPLSHLETYILGKDMELLPIGTTGELFIGGKSVSTGYINNPEEAKARFLDNPFAKGNMYKTGDLARWTADGTIQYLGRIDEQLQVRGYRVETGEISGQIESHSKIKEATVIGREDGDETSLMAFFTSDESISATELREFLVQRLPGYMVPAYFRKVDELPTTQNGKLDKAALRESQKTGQVDESKPFESMPMKGDSFEPAQSELEHELVTIWAEILKLDPSGISIGKSFFEIGGHSLRAIVMINKILEATGVTVPLRDVFQYQNIKSIAAFISQQEKNFDSHLDKAPLLPDYPLSSPQRRLYFLYEMEKESLVYNMPRMVRLEGDLDEQRIEAAFRQLIERHEILRTSYVMTNDEPRQQVLTEVSFELERFVASRAELQATFDSFVQPFDLASGQLIRAGIVSSTEDPNDFVLMVDQHHIATDGVSQGILINEFMALYEDKPLEALSLQYKDFAWWQHGLSGEGSFKESETFWKTEFAGEVPVLNLPTDFERPVFKQNQGEMYGFSLDQETYQSLRKLTENTGTTLYTVVLSIFNIVLARLGNQEDIVVGTPVAGRQHAQLESMAGMFVNTLPIRNFPGGTKSFLTFLNEVQERNLDCFDHQSYPYEELVESLLLTRDTSRNPLFDVLLSYQNFETASLEISGMSMESLANPHRVSKFDMTLHATEAPSELRLGLEYSTELFTRETIERFSGYFIRVAEAIVLNPEMLIRDIDMLGSEERSLVTKTFNKEDHPVGAQKTEKNLVQLFKEQVNTTPNQRALVFKDEQLTYLELDQRSDQLALALRQKDVGAGDMIGILIDRSSALIVAILGVLKTGCAYLPIDVQNPVVRTKQILAEGKAKLLLTSLNYQEAYEDTLPVFIPETEQMQSAGQASDQPPMNLSNELMAYVIFTSGTTGKPKGVPISHTNVINLIESQQKIYQIEEEENILLFSNIAFDASVEQIWLALLHGATLVVSASDHIENPAALNQYLVKNEVTHLHTTPSYLATLDLQEPNYIRRIVVGGEALPQKLADRYAQDYELYNEYGPTEITVTATVAELKKDEAVTIGRPLSHLETYILGKNMELLPIGTVGELFIGGKSVSTGYINNPEEAKARFLDNPFAEGNMYKTGDLARWNLDGTIQYLGRIDEQFQVRGYRVETGEISGQIESHPKIKEAAVIGWQDRDETSLMAFFTSDELITVTELREFLIQRLPGYMVPTDFRKIDELPTTQNGKLDKASLRESQSLISSAYEKPENEVEQTLVNIWAEGLKLNPDKIGVTQSFFELGGHSLKAIMVLAKINREYQVEFPLRMFFTIPTIRECAAVLQTMTMKETEVSATNQEEEFIF